MLELRYKNVTDQFNPQYVLQYRIKYDATIYAANGLMSCQQQKQLVWSDWIDVPYAD